MIQNMCQLTVLLVNALVNSRLLVVKFPESKVVHGFLTSEGGESVTFTSVLFKHQLYIPKEVIKIL